MALKGFMNDEGALTNRTREFYMYKTIQRAYNFMVMFDESWTSTVLLGPELGNESLAITAEATDYGMATWQDMSSYHAVSVDIPDYQFQKEQFKVGPFVNTFPVLNHEGFNFSIKMEEDFQGRVKSLIMGLTSNIIDRDGYYHPFTRSVIPNINVDIFQQDGTNVWKIRFLNCYFLKAEGGTYDYSSNDKITYTLEFNCDHYEIVAKQGSINKTLIRSGF